MISSPTFLSILAIFQRIEVFQKETEPSDIMLYVINADPEAIGAGHESVDNTVRCPHVHCRLREEIGTKLAFYAERNELEQKVFIKTINRNAIIEHPVVELVSIH